MSLFTRTTLMVALVLPAAGCEVVERLELYAQERIDAHIDQRLEQLGQEDPSDDPVNDGAGQDPGTGTGSDGSTTDDPWDDPVQDEPDLDTLAVVTFVNDGPDVVGWIDAETCDGEWLAPIVDQHPLMPGGALTVSMPEGCYRLFIEYGVPNAAEARDALVEEMQVLAGEQYLFHL